MTEDLFDGVTIRLGRRDYVVPPLNLRAVKRIELLLPVLSGESGQQGTFIDAAIEVLHLALLRNYPDITKGEIEELVDLGNLPRLIGAVMAVSGFGPKGQGEAATPSA